MTDHTRDLPPHLIRDLAPPRPHPGDRISERIAQLLRLHPDVDREYPDLGLRRLMPSERRRLLAEIEGRLGIPMTLDFRPIGA